MQPQGQFITLRDRGEAKAVIAPDLGGWLLRYIRHIPEHGYVDVLYYDQAVVGRYPHQMYAGNPILFPLVSFNHVKAKKHHYEWQGSTWALPQHGFARQSKWKVVKVSQTLLTMELVSNESSRRQYPFGFRHRVTYELAKDRLYFRQQIENTSNRVMPFSTGIHPYFPVPMVKGSKRAKCFLELPAARKIAGHKEWETWTAEPFEAQRLSVDQDFSGTMFLTDLQKAEISLVDPKARLRIRLNFAEAPQHRFVALWSKSREEPFFCVEPWTALPNSFTRKDTELILLDPGRKFDATMWIALEGA